MDEHVIQTGTEMPDHGGGADFPPFDATTYGSQLLWLALTFGALYWIMSRLVIPRVGSILEVRRDRIANDLAEAQRLKEETDEAIAAYEQALAEARAKAQGIAAETRAKVVAEADAGQKKLEAELAERLARAEADIRETKTKALGNVRGIAVETASVIVEQLVGKSPKEADVEAAVDAALAS